MLWLISQRQLLPGIVIMGSFILLVLWTVGLIVISIELWGPRGSVNSNCQLYVNGRPSTGASTQTLAWLMQRSICKLFYLLSFCCYVSRKYLTRCRGIAIARSFELMCCFYLGQSWTAAWAFQLVGCVFLLWMMIMAYQVYRDD